MPRCIFCKSTTASFTTQEHILPESLGGGDWGVLPPNLFCDKCQNHFGSKIEREALGDYPFSLLRVFLGIPTKKGKAPWFKNSLEGVFRGSPLPGQVGYDPTEIFSDAVESGQKTVARILAHPKRPNKICRVLLKMGIEIVAADDADVVFDTKYDAAREYALKGSGEKKWWYLQREDMDAANRYITGSVTHDEWAGSVQLSTYELDHGAEMFRLKLFWLDMMTPLDDRILLPDVSDFPEPEYQLFVA